MRPPMTAPGTIPTAMNSRSSGRSWTRRAESPAAMSAATIDHGERDRLPAHDEALGEVQQRVEIERDDGDRHGAGQCIEGGGVGWPTPPAVSAAGRRAVGERTSSRDKPVGHGGASTSRGR